VGESPQPPIGFATAALCPSDRRDPPVHIPLAVGHMLGDHVATEVEQRRRARALLPVALGGREDPTAEGAPDEGGNQRSSVALRGGM
jgi:hypothetical protein